MDLWIFKSKMPIIIVKTWSHVPQCGAADHDMEKRLHDLTHIYGNFLNLSTNNNWFYQYDELHQLIWTENCVQLEGEVGVMLLNITMEVAHRSDSHSRDEVNTFPRITSSWVFPPQWTRSSKWVGSIEVVHIHVSVFPLAFWNVIKKRIN
jgi:hypothetical protein